MRITFRNFRYRFAIALLGSAFLHVLFGGGLALSPSLPGRQKASTEVVLLTPDELKMMQTQQAAVKGQVVESSERALNDEVDPNAKYLSRHNQKVVTETRAMKTGAFKNDAGQGGQTGSVPPAPNADTSPPTETADSPKVTARLTDPNEDIEIEGQELQSKPKPNTGLAAFSPSFRKLPTVSESKASGDGHEPSATDDHLENVKTGMETMLSTREFIYYSYYNRIKEKLRQYWEPKIKEKFERIIRQGRTIASDGGNKITKVIIVLNEHGTLIGVQVVGPSGVTDLDDAAIEAFRAAAPFPNPPKGIVEADGTIKIRWDFVLEA